MIGSESGFLGDDSIGRLTYYKDRPTAIGVTVRRILNLSPKP